MALSDDLKDPYHPVTRLVDDFLPGREEWISQVQAMARAATHEVPAGSPGRTTIGNAFEFSVGLDLEVERPYERLLGLLPPAHAAWVLDRPEDSTTELLKRAYYLAVIDDLLFRNGTGAALFLDHFQHPRGIISHFEQSKSELEQLWLLYDRGPRVVLQGAARVQLAPVVHVDPVSGRPRRVADLLADSTLVEIKTGHVYRERAGLDVALRQLLVYAALARHNGFTVENVALYLAQVGLLLEWPLSELLPQLADGPVDLRAFGSALAFATDCRSA